MLVFFVSEIQNSRGFLIMKFSKSPFVLSLFFAIWFKHVCHTHTPLSIPGSIHVTSIGKAPRPISRKDSYYGNVHFSNVHFKIAHFKYLWTLYLKIQFYVYTKSAPWAPLHIKIAVKEIKMPHVVRKVW